MYHLERDRKLASAPGHTSPDPPDDPLQALPQRLELDHGDSHPAKTGVDEMEVIVWKQ